MSGILDQIDDTLADWNGSADSMRWRPDGGAENEPQMTGTLVTAAGFMATVQNVVLQTASTLPPPFALDELPLYLEPFTLEFEFPLAEPTPEQDYWEAAALRRHICAAFAIAPRDLGMPPRYGFDARYRQRQKNRRKRRR